MGGIKTRPLPESGVSKFTQFIGSHGWEEVLGEENIDQKVINFHKTLRTKLEECCPEKTVMVSYLDKKWMTPQLKKFKSKIKEGIFQKPEEP